MSVLLECGPCQTGCGLPDGPWGCGAPRGCCFHKVHGPVGRRNLQQIKAFQSSRRWARHPNTATWRPRRGSCLPPLGCGGGGQEGSGHQHREASSDSPHKNNLSPFHELAPLSGPQNMAEPQPPLGQFPPPSPSFPSTACPFCNSPHPTHPQAPGKLYTYSTS